DKTGQIRLALWDSDAEKVENNEIKIGTILEIQYAYAKDGYQGQLEIALGRSGKIVVNPENVDPRDVPEISSVFKKIGDLTSGLSSVSVRARIISDIIPRTVNTKDGRETQIINLTIADDTGNIDVPLWENHFSKCKGMKKGDKIEITNGYVTEGFQNKLELRIGNATQIQINPATGSFPKTEELDLTTSSSEAPIKAGQLMKVKDLVEKSTNVDIFVKCTELRETRQGTRKDGTDYKVRDAIMSDETGSINVPLWDEMSDAVEVGKTYKISNGYVSSYRGTLNLNIGRLGKIERVTKKIGRINKRIRAVEAPRKRINEVQENETVRIRGTILRIPEQNVLYKACPNCNKKINNSGSPISCEHCGSEITPVHRMRWSFTLDDGFGNLRVTLFGDVAESVLGMTIKEAEDIIQESLSEQEPLLQRSNDLLGREVIVQGRIRFRNDIPDLVAQSVEPIDLKNELTILLKQT
ncbi:MAG: hypothetical protein ACTSRW_04475, partial [Candidatus Helarchaeota archaeon]